MPAARTFGCCRRLSRARPKYAICCGRSAKYDRLGVDKALRQIWSAMDRKRLVALEQFLPTLDRIANNESYMHTARAKAAELGETIRKGTPAAQ
jgi:hypothetical protein